MVALVSLLIMFISLIQYNFKEKGFLTFEPLTLVPIQKKMILPELLTEKEVCERGEEGMEGWKGGVGARG